jgi:SAM-dependent methyltransferase
MPQELQRCLSSKTIKSSNCPLCGKPVVNAPYLFTREGVESLIYACKGCDFLFGRPVFIPEQNQRQMDSIADAELYNSKLLRLLHRELILKREVRKVRSILGGGQHRVLDIGCGTGWTSAFWRDNGFDVTGLEPSAARRAVAQEKYGIPVIGDYLEDAEIDQQFDVVILRHIIEHFESPADLLSKAAEFVAPGGVLLVVVPNIKCLGRYLYDTYWTWVLPWHCNFFSPHSLQVLIEGVGFQVAKSYQTPSPMYYQESLLRRFPASGLKKNFQAISPLGMLVFTPLIATGLLVGLGDNLCAIARRSEDRV